MTVGISIGWASFGNDGDSLDEMLLAADRAITATKRGAKAYWPRQVRQPLKIQANLAPCEKRDA